ncbi:unnamed protein product [Hydatigera taeniaeformis]|uniref:Nas2_N domain-containing protein n=1 Tax=Hydatigena taeniaeformis TaxID=6205 RepID=A0A0R3X8G1_HYDTA|nr:unnamed protein product [Hydatigera taeniaeformis]
MADNSTDMVLFQELEKKRQSIVNEINTYTAVLEGNRNVGMHGPLLDSEGFPRSDIDVVAVRTALSSFLFVGLNTDHNEVMKQLETVSARLLSKTRGGAEEMDTDSPIARPSTEPPSRSVPFLLVDQVAPGSPADQAVGRPAFCAIGFCETTPAKHGLDLKQLFLLLFNIYHCPKPS